MCRCDDFFFLFRDLSPRRFEIHIYIRILFGKQATVWRNNTQVRRNSICMVKGSRATWALPATDSLGRATDRRSRATVGPEEVLQPERGRVMERVALRRVLRAASRSTVVLAAQEDIRRQCLLLRRTILGCLRRMRRSTGAKPQDTGAKLTLFFFRVTRAVVFFFRLQNRSLCFVFAACLSHPSNLHHELGAVLFCRPLAHTYSLFCRRRNDDVIFCLFFSQATAATAADDDDALAAATTTTVPSSSSASPPAPAAGPGTPKATAHGRRHRQLGHGDGRRPSQRCVTNIGERERKRVDVFRVAFLFFDSLTERSLSLLFTTNS